MTQSTINAPLADPMTAPPAPPPTPRELPATVGARLWNEPSVRFWWASGLIVFLLTAYVAGREISSWLKDRRLYAEGVVVDAKIEEVDGTALAGRPVRSESVCRLAFEWKDSRHVVVGRLQALSANMLTLKVGSVVPLRVDPNDPERWTDRTSPVPLARQLIGAAVGLLAVIALIALAMRRRKALARVWRTGEATPMIVVESRQTALAPRSRAIRCIAAESTDQRVFTVYVPHAIATIRPGEIFWALSGPAMRPPVVAANWFE